MVIFGQVHKIGLEQLDRLVQLQMPVTSSIGIAVVATGVVGTTGVVGMAVVGGGVVSPEVAGAAVVGI